MTTFKDYLIESFNSKPVNFKKNNQNKSSANFSFRIDSILYEVDFDLRDEKSKTWDVVFSGNLGSDPLDGTQELTGTGNQFKVLSTVMSIIIDFINNNEIKFLKFSASKEDIGGNPAAGRSKVYRRLIKRRLRELPGNWTVREDELDFLVKFTLINNSN